MTVTAEEDFRDFVTARWADLEPVACLVVLDGPAARQVTTEALADLHGEWGHLIDEGMPGATARRAVLTRALAAIRHHPGVRRDDVLPALLRADAAHEDEQGDTVVLAMARVVAEAAPLERAVLAAATVWGLDPGRVADLLEMPPATARDADLEVRRRLLAAHATARAAAGWEPAEWAVDRDLDDALDLLLGEHGDPPDAVALVGERNRQVRRRSVVLGTGATLVTGVVAAWGVDSVVTGAASETAPLPPRPGDPVWTTSNTWPARGRLATDAGVAALVESASPRAHVLWADDLAGQRVVVAAPADGSGSGGTLVRVWAGSRGADPASLTAVDLARDRVALMDDVVPLAVEAGVDDEDGTGAVLLLARPTVLEASYSPLVAYERNGGVGRRWTKVALRDGVATVPIRGPMPPTFRVHLDGYDGGPLGVTPLGLPTPHPSDPLAESLLDALAPFVAACTGLPESAVRSTLALEMPVPGDVLVAAGPGERIGRGKVVVALTTLPNNALLRSVRVVGDGRGQVGPLDLETTRVVGAADVGAPFATRLPAFSSSVSRFLVVAPGAARAQLVGSATNTYPASKVTPLRDGTGVLEVADVRRAALYRLVIWDRHGGRLGGWETLVRRRDPRDLWPRVR